MSKHYYPTIFLPEKTDDGLYDGFSVIVPDLPGCVSQGDYLLDATKMATSAIDCWLDGTDEKDYPKPSKINEVDTSEYDQEYPNLFVNIVEYDPSDFKHTHNKNVDYTAEHYSDGQAALSL